MYKLILVDDEHWVIESLKSSIDWRKHGFEVVGQAENGIKAYALICSIKPDLVITDIRMPGMNGLELIKKVKESNPRVLFIIISGYAEFAYAQMALNYGAIGYCLKPFEEKDIAALLSNAVQFLQTSPSSLPDDEALEIFEEMDPCKCIKLQSVLNKAGLDLKKGIAAIVCIGTQTAGFSPAEKYIAFKSGINKRAYLVNHNEIVIDFLQKQLSNGIKGVGIGSAVQNVLEIRKSVEEATIAAYGFFITKEKGIFKNEEFDNQEYADLFKRLDDTIRTKDMHSMEKCMAEIHHLFKSKHTSVRFAFFVYNMINSTLYKSMPEIIEYSLDCYERLVSEFHDVDSMLEYLKGKIKDVICSPIVQTTKETGNCKLDEILAYINSNFFKDISIQMLSDKFFIHPNYISYLFKRHLGINYTDYINKLRISHACNLLRESRLSIQDISERVGYNDYFYFTRIFKRMTGKTPSSYRLDSQAKREYC